MDIKTDIFNNIKKFLQEFNGPEVRNKDGEIMVKNLTTKRKLKVLWEKISKKIILKVVLELMDVFEYLPPRRGDDFWTRVLIIGGDLDSGKHDIITL